jgi:predicted nucleotidyltransferase
MKIRNLISTLRRIFEKDEEILFAYLYGSHVSNIVHFESDIDIAIYLKASDIKKHLRKEKELTSALVTKFHTDKIDLRILNSLPFLLQYRIVKEGIPILVKDASERVNFEIGVMNRFFELRPYLDEYYQMLSSRINSGI